MAALQLLWPAELLPVPSDALLSTHLQTSEGWTGELAVSFWLVIPTMGFEPMGVDLTRLETLRLNDSATPLIATSASHPRTSYNYGSSGRDATELCTIEDIRGGGSVASQHPLIADDKGSSKTKDQETRDIAMRH